MVDTFPSSWNMLDWGREMKPGSKSRMIGLKRAAFLGPDVILLQAPDILPGQLPRLLLWL